MTSSKTRSRILKTALVAGTMVSVIFLIRFGITSFVSAQVASICSSYEDQATSSKAFGDLLQFLTLTGGFGSETAANAFAEKYTKTDEDANFEQFCLRKQRELCKRFGIPARKASHLLGLSILLEHADDAAANRKDKEELVEAQDLLTQALAEDARSGGQDRSEILKNRGWCKILQAQYDAALIDLENALTSKPSKDETVSIREMMASCYRHLNREQDALLQCKEIVKQSPSAMAFKTMGDCEMAQANFAEARRSFQTALKLATKESDITLIKILIDQTADNGAQLEAYKALGYTKMHALDFRGAIKSLEQGMEITAAKSQLVELRNMLALAYSGSGKGDDALKQYQTALKIMPNTRSYEGIAECYTTLGEFPKALKAYESALTVASSAAERARVKTSIGKVLYSMKRFSEANDQFEAATKLASSPENLLGSADCAFAQTDFGKARALYAQVLKSGNNTLAFRGMAECDFKTGNFSRAEDLLQKAIAESFRYAISLDTVNRTADLLELLIWQGKKEQAFSLAKKEVEVAIERRQQDLAAALLVLLTSAQLQNGDIEQGLSSVAKLKTLKFDDPTGTFDRLKFVADYLSALNHSTGNIPEIPACLAEFKGTEADSYFRPGWSRWPDSGKPIELRLLIDDRLKCEPLEKLVAKACNAWNTQHCRIKFCGCKPISMTRIANEKYEPFTRPENEIIVLITLRNQTFSVNQKDWSRTSIVATTSTRCKKDASLLKERAFVDLPLASLAMTVPSTESTYRHLLHELGHSLGLEHSAYPDDIMFPDLDFAQGVSKRDRATLELLYSRNSNSATSNR